MKIILKQTTHLSLDGVHTHKYEAGKVYEATSAHAKRVFATLLEQNKADSADNAPTEQGTDTAKIRKPKEHK